MADSSIARAPNIFFLRWFVNWMRRPREVKADSAYPNF